MRAGRPAAAAGHEARGDHPVQEAEHARGADASGGARVAVPAEAPRPARLALLCRVIVRHQLAVYVRNIARVSVSVGLQRHDDVEHAHHEKPRLALAPRRRGVVAVTGRPQLYICLFFPFFFRLVFIPGWDCRVGIDGMIVLLAHRICLLDFIRMLLTIKLLIGPSVVDCRQELCI